MTNTNIPAITIKEFIDIVEMQLREHNMRPVFGLGKGGIGKSESMAELAKKLNIGYVDIRLLLYTESDLKGIPYPNAEHTKTIWLQNNILPTEEKDGREGILVLDEITSTARSVRTAAYQLLNERKLGEYKLPDGWLVVCLGNGEEDGGDFNGMEGNFANRCSVYEIVTDVEVWKEWAQAKKVNDLVLGYINFRSVDLHTYNPNNETELLFASPRSWKAVSDILNATPFDENNTILRHRIIGNIGKKVGMSFLAFCKYKDQAINPEDIVEGRITSDTCANQEITLITIQSVIRLMAESIEKDKNENNGYISERTFRRCANGIKWMLKLRSMEYTVMGIKDFVSVNRTAVIKIMLSPQFRQLCPEIVQFATENAKVFSV